MKKLLLLFVALLTGISGAWAESFTVTLHSQSQQAPTTSDSKTHASISSTTFTTKASSGLTGLKFLLTTTNGGLTWDRGGSNTYYLNLKHTATTETTNTLTIQAPAGFNIKGYSLEVCDWNNTRTYTVTAADGTSINVTSTTAKTLTVSGLNTASTTITLVANATGNTPTYFAIKNFTVTVEPIMIDDGLYQLQLKGQNYKITATTSTCKAETNDVSLFTISSTGSRDANGYPTYNIKQGSKYLVYSEAVYSNGNNVKLSLSEEAKPSNKDFIICKSGDYVQIRPSMTADNSDFLRTYWTIWSVANSQNIVFWTLSDTQSNWSLIPMDIENNKLYRLRQTWTQGGGSNYYYIYANTSDATNGLKKGTTKPRINDANYVWQPKFSESYWQLYNVGSHRYIKTAASASTNGNKTNALTTTDNDASEAEAFNIFGAISNLTYQPTDYASKKYVALKASSQSSIYLDSWSIDKNDYVGWHTGVHYGYYFRFDPVKTVTFSTAVDVNGEGAVSTIYVAKDGSDAFSLPVNYKYTFGGKDYNIAAEAAAAIATAGDEDINVTVTELSSYPITMNSDNTHAYATAYLPFPIRMQTGVKAYKAVSTGTNTLILSKVADAANTADDGDILAAGTAAILWKEGATSSASLSFDVVTSSKAAPDDNLLSGTYEDASVPNGKNAYVLYGGANGVGFYPLDGTDLPLYKAYYLEDKSLPVKSFSFSFNDIVNGIQKAELDERLSQGQVYDLSGRHIEKPMRGIYIQNGRKFIIK